MNLRKKVILIVGTVFIGVVCSLLLLNYFISTTNTQQLERSHSAETAQIVRLTLQQQIASLDATTQDWAAWDDTYQFARDGNQQFIDSNLLDATFQTLTLNLIAIFDNSGNPVFVKFFDLERQTEIEPPSELYLHISTDSPLLEHSGPESSESGLIAVNNAPMLVAARPILTSLEQGPTRGTIVFGRYLAASPFTALIAARHPIEIYTGDDPNEPADFQTARKHLESTGKGWDIRARDDDTMSVYISIPDISGKTNVLVRVDEDRDVFRQERVSRLWFAGSLVLVGIVLGATLLIVLDRIVLARLRDLNTDIERVRIGEDLTARVFVSGTDEISYLANSINVLLETLEGSQDKLVRSESLLRQVFDTTPSLIFLKNHQGKYILVNEAWSRFFDIPVEEALGKTDRDLAKIGRLVQEDAEKLAEQSMRVLTTGETQPVSEIRVIGPKATPHWLQMVEAPLTLHGDSSHVLGMAIDITRWKQLESQLLQSQKIESLGKLAGGIAHDFNNLLTVILGNAELASGEIQADSPAHEYLAQIMISAKRTSRMIGQLMLFSRQSQVELDLIDLNDVVAQVTKMLRSLIGEDILVLTICEPDLGLVEADAGQIEQALINLAINARDAMPLGGTLTIETANLTVREELAAQYVDIRFGEYVAISVTDTGEGMSEEVLAHIFEPFFSTKAAGKGTGLGLATAYGIITRHGGHIRVDSKLAHGSTFKILLPRVDHSEKAGYSLDAELALPSGSETILVVEDEPLVRDTMTRWLRKLGYTVLEAADGKEAERLVNKHDGQIDLLLTDIVMPLMTGRELVEAIQTGHPTIRALFMSGYDSHCSLADLTCDDANAPFLRKPLTPVALASKVRQVLDGAGCIE